MIQCSSACIVFESITCLTFTCFSLSSWFRSEISAFFAASLCAKFVHIETTHIILIESTVCNIASCRTWWGSRKSIQDKKSICHLSFSKLNTIAGFDVPTLSTGLAFCCCSYRSEDIQVNNVMNLNLLGYLQWIIHYSSYKGDIINLLVTATHLLKRSLPLANHFLSLHLSRSELLGSLVQCHLNQKKMNTYPR